MSTRDSKSREVSEQEKLVEIHQKKVGRYKLHDNYVENPEVVETSESSEVFLTILKNQEGLFYRCY